MQHESIALAAMAGLLLGLLIAFLLPRRLAILRERLSFIEAQQEIDRGYWDERVAALEHKVARLQSRPGMNLSAQTERETAGRRRSPLQAQPESKASSRPAEAELLRKIEGMRRRAAAGNAHSEIRGR
jgi:hypothetical protein